MTKLIQTFFLYLYLYIEYSLLERYRWALSSLLYLLFIHVWTRVRRMLDDGNRWNFDCILQTLGSSFDLTRLRVAWPAGELDDGSQQSSTALNSEKAYMWISSQIGDGTINHGWHRWMDVLSLRRPSHENKISGPKIL